MKLQFKEQKFQLDATNSVVDVFAGQPYASRKFDLKRTRELMANVKRMTRGDKRASLVEEEVYSSIGYTNKRLSISEADLLANIRTTQRNNNIFESTELLSPEGYDGGVNLTIEMETGTGKTYTYIRTMYELHKKYGWSKFIVIVPSIAIREGVHKTFEVTQDHFQELYGHKINPFIYNSARPQDIESFASDSRISVMIINNQAFNARGEAARRIFQELDQFGSRKPIDIIAKTNPILIIDEPQSVEGKKTLESLKDFNPLLTLRYSATHKHEYNKVYRLDALDAYNLKLVKKIQVKGISLKSSGSTDGYLYLEHISLSTTKPPFAIVEFEKRTKQGISRTRRKLSERDNLYELSGKIPAYKNMTISEINGYLNKITVNGKDIYPGEIINNPDEHAFRRIQIRECIKSHIEKEKQLFEKGIKVLSLFFLDSVENYRKYTDEGVETKGEYAKIFEEEYASELKKIDSNTSSEFKKYLLGSDVSAIHNGYFSIDKKGKSVDPTVKRGKDYSEDISAYDLIMKNKERLLDFDEPTRFIFSHSALKEGWDNPNVFQICALKHADSGSSTRRRQEVGRGMRLCVDNNGYRQDFDSIGEEVHEINRLTVIASESYEEYAKGLQKEISNTITDRPKLASIEYFTGKTVFDLERNEYRLTQEDSKKINKKLYKHDIIDDDDRITTQGRTLIASSSIELPNGLLVYKKSICDLLKLIYTGSETKPENERKIITLDTNSNFENSDFQKLWEKISYKSIYRISFDTPTLIKESVDLINQKLIVSDKYAEIHTGEMDYGTAEDLKNSSIIKKTNTEREDQQSIEASHTVYDLLGEIEIKTDLKRSTIGEILKTINPEKFDHFSRNPEEFIIKISALINEVKSSLIVGNIVYSKTNERFDIKNIFSSNKFAKRDSELLKKHIYDYITTDSTVELDFAKELDKDGSDVVVYAKLPKSFYITTPVAKYSPDWAIVFNSEKIKSVYFVVETKGTEKDMELRGIEKLKIKCAKEHFAELSRYSEGSVEFTVISKYNSLYEKLEKNG